MGFRPGDEDRTRLKRGIVVDRDVLGTVGHLDEITDTSPVDTAHVVEDIVAEENTFRALTDVEIVRTLHVHARGNVANDVVAERDVAHHGPWRASVLITRRE